MICFLLIFYYLICRKKYCPISENFFSLNHRKLKLKAWTCKRGIALWVEIEKDPNSYGIFLSFSFAIVGINMTEMCVTLLNKRQFRSYIYSFEKPDPGLTDFHRIYCEYKHIAVSVLVLEQEIAMLVAFFISEIEK